ncbi:MAG: PDZ domain-containing protein [Bacteroidales bacterium]
MGLLGAKISADPSGYFRIDKILEGANWSRSLRSPLKDIGVNVNEGDFIIAVNGKSVKGVTDIFTMLVGQANTEVQLTVNSKATEAGSRNVLVTPSRARLTFTITTGYRITSGM